MAVRAIGSMRSAAHICARAPTLTTRARACTGCSRAPGFDGPPGCYRAGFLFGLVIESAIAGVPEIPYLQIEVALEVCVIFAEALGNGLLIGSVVQRLFLVPAVYGELGDAAVAAKAAGAPDPAD